MPKGITEGNLNKYPQELRDFVIDMAIQGVPDSTIIFEVEKQFGVKIKCFHINQWFRHSICDLIPTGDRDFIKNMNDSKDLASHIAYIVHNAKVGDTISYKTTEPVNARGINISVIREATVIKLYSNYILTDKGCIQLSDIKGVKHEQETQKQASCI